MRQLCLLLFIFCIKISAQTEVKGFVIPVERQQTFKANIILLDENNEIETFGFSDKTGSFSVFTDKLGTFKLQIKAFNFNSKEIDYSSPRKWDSKFSWKKPIKFTICHREENSIRSLSSRLS